MALMNKVSSLSPPYAALPHILAVDDDDRLRSLLRRYLSEQGFLVTTAANAAEARAKLDALSVDLIVLDVMMPGETGLELTSSLRQQRASNAAAKPYVPILLLTARSESSDRIEGFELGADDYLAKPFEPRELLLRIQAILRRAVKTQAAALELRFGKWRYDATRDELTSEHESVKLTDMEAGLLRVLAAEPGVAVSREILAERSGGTISDRTVDVQVTRLRRKIEVDAKNPRYLVTVRGEGYMLMPDIDHV